ncbi:hypothetical protein SS50377_26971 [Spironucleus salmonicida]|uniref:Uncharacterized protein n=1 Tax=Spironucleus salmonicida TaxID=348837 RepID=V6LT99_9EUKA|nr:hypothetical protein SS50377_26971 [Spironucleus salmonicida]|eukprot:EST47483.1 hypothetical protein SS50377_12467 [Spironucleus salmonicida]
MAFSRIVRDLEYQEVPEVLELNQYFCVNIHPVGNLLFQVKPLSITETFTNNLTAQLPAKFDKKILFGRGDLCICTFNDGVSSDEIGRIDMLLTKENLKELVKDGRIAPSEIKEEAIYNNYILEDVQSSESYY